MHVSQLGLHSREGVAGLGCSWGGCLPSGSLEHRATLHPALLCACLGLLLPVLWTQWQGALAPGMSPDKSAVFFILSGIRRMWPGKEQVYLNLAESKLAKALIRVLLLGLFVWLWLLFSFLRRHSEQKSKPTFVLGM